MFIGIWKSWKCRSKRLPQLLFHCLNSRLSLTSKLSFDAAWPVVAALVGTLIGSLSIFIICSRCSKNTSFFTIPTHSSTPSQFQSFFYFCARWYDRFIYTTAFQPRARWQECLLRYSCPKLFGVYDVRLFSTYHSRMELVVCAFTNSLQRSCSIAWIYVYSYFVFVYSFQGNTVCQNSTNQRERDCP